MSHKQLGLAVIGSGRIGSLRAILAAGHPAVKYLGVSDIDIENAKKLADKSNAQKFTDDNHELISDPNVNVVIVSTSEHEHFDSVMHALELGKPVLVEKPIADLVVILFLLAINSCSVKVPMCQLSSVVTSTSAIARGVNRAQIITSTFRL